MSSFYEEESKLTYDRAGVLVHRYLRKHTDLRATVTVAEICQTMDVEKSHHNQIRVREAVEYFCSETSQGGQRTRYELPDEVPDI